MNHAVFPEKIETVSFICNFSSGLVVPMPNLLSMYPPTLSEPVELAEPLM